MDLNGEKVMIKMINTSRNTLEDSLKIYNNVQESKIQNKNKPHTTITKKQCKRKV
jgi:hypothetical protein